MQKEPGVYINDKNTEEAVQNCFNGELNHQVLHLMQSLSIDISKTKKVRISSSNFRCFSLL